MDLFFRVIPFQSSVALTEPYAPGTTFPIALETSKEDKSISTITKAVRDATENGQIQQLLDAHGAIYFKGLGLKSAAEFSDFTHAFGWQAHEDIGNPVRRVVHAPNVASANEGPRNQPVYPHNEFALSSHYPAYVFFYCLKAPDTGGETPIDSSLVVYHRLKAKHPEFIDQLQKLGVQYRSTFPNTARDQTESPGTSVLQAWGKHVLDSDDIESTRAKVEKEIRRLPTATWIWENQSESNPLGDLATVQKLPAIRLHEETGKLAFFNNVVSRFRATVDAGTTDPPHISKQGKYQPPPMYGDGSLIPKNYLFSAYEIIRETRALVSWTAGDILLLDYQNHAVQHGREPWTGDRVLLASLWDQPST